MKEKNYIFKLACKDARGTVSKTTSKLAELGAFITELDQFSDTETDRFFMRIAFDLPENKEEETKQALTETLQQIKLPSWSLRWSDQKYKVLILCSKIGHCLSHLLYKWSEKSLDVDIPAIISNHPDLKKVADWHEIPFHHLPITPETKKEREAEIAEIIESKGIDYIVLARYMQILSPEFCETYKNRIINIHHSFLPGFKGAKPYQQAYDRGVKIIGATSHFVTPDLDEGPIILQDVIRVSHRHTVSDLTRYGADIESVVLSRAVKYVSEDRVFVNGHKTIVFK